jgi:hypothetical protein
MVMAISTKSFLYIHDEPLEIDGALQKGLKQDTFSFKFLCCHLDYFEEF